MDKSDLKYQEVEQENYAVVAAEAVEPTSLGVTPDVNQQAKNVTTDDDEALALSDDFIRFLCCAFTCSNHDYPKDFGFKAGRTILCYEMRMELLRFPQNDPKACFNLCANSVECIWPRKCCRSYDQCFCFECFAQLPIPEGGIRRLPKLTKERDITANFNPASNVLFCWSSDCCSYYNCSCDFPSCIGTYRKGVCLCTEYENIGWKPMCCVDNKPDPHTLCILSKGHMSLVMPYTCWKSIGQWCCCDFRSAFPCDEEVPCIYSMCCCCTACVNWQCNVNCCKTIAQIMGNDGKGIAARQQQEQFQAQQQQFQAQQAQFQAQQAQFQTQQQQQAPQQQQVPIVQAEVNQVEMAPSAPIKQE